MANPPPRVTGALACAALLATAGALMVWAAWDRWYPDCWGANLHTQACWFPQDDSYDAMLHSVPGIHAQLLAATSAHVLVVLFFLLLPWVTRCAGGRVLAVIGAAGPLGMAIGTALPPRPGPWDHPLQVLAGFLMIFGVGLGGWMAAAALLPVTDWRGGPTYLAVVAIGVGLANPLVDYVIAGAALSYSSHDTNPWSGTPTGVCLLIAAAGMLGVARLLRRHAVEPSPLPEPVGQTV